MPVIMCLDDRYKDSKQVLNGPFDFQSLDIEDVHHFSKKVELKRNLLKNEWKNFGRYSSYFRFLYQFIDVIHRETRVSLNILSLI